MSASHSTLATEWPVTHHLKKKDEVCLPRVVAGTRGQVAGYAENGPRRPEEQIAGLYHHAVTSKGEVAWAPSSLLLLPRARVATGRAVRPVL